MDAFSEVLNGVRLKGAMFFRAEFSAPWQLSTPHCRALAPTLAPGAPHMLIYHFVVDGSARVCLEGEPEVELSPGDIVLFPHGDPHHLRSGSGSNQLDGASLLRKVATHDLSPMHAGGGGAMTGFVCGYLTCDPLLCGPILESLPPMLKVNIRTDRPGQWLEAPPGRGAVNATITVAPPRGIWTSMFRPRIAKPSAASPEQMTGRTGSPATT